MIFSSKIFVNLNRKDGLTWNILWGLPLSRLAWTLWALFPPCLEFKISFFFLAYAVILNRIFYRDVRPCIWYRNVLTIDLCGYSWQCLWWCATFRRFLSRRRRDSARRRSLFPHQIWSSGESDARMPAGARFAMILNAFFTLWILKQCKKYFKSVRNLHTIKNIPLSSGAFLREFWTTSLAT